AAVQCVGPGAGDGGAGCGGGLAGDPAGGPARAPARRDADPGTRRDPGDAQPLALLPDPGVAAQQRHPAAHRPGHGARHPRPGARRRPDGGDGTAACRPAAERGPDGQQHDAADRRQPAARRRAQWRTGGDERQARRLPGRRPRPAGGDLLAPVRTVADDGHRHRGRRHRRVDVHPDLRPGGEHRFVNVELQAPELEQPEPDLALVQEVRMRARSGQRPWPLLLQDELGLAPPALVEMLARLSGIPAIATAELYAGAVDFGLLGYVECVRRCCALLRTEAGGIRLVLADPFSQETVAWARASLQAPYEVRLAHPDDINAALSAAEQAVRATERTFADDDGLAEAADGDAELLSLEAIAGDSSPVVKLVSSILYDALKQRASDIHLKSSPTGMAVKFRL